MTASAVSLPARPLITSLIVPSPPTAITTSQPPSAAARASSVAWPGRSLWYSSTVHPCSRSHAGAVASRSGEGSVRATGLTIRQACLVTGISGHDAVWPDGYDPTPILRHPRGFRLQPARAGGRPVMVLFSWLKTPSGLSRKIQACTIQGVCGRNSPPDARQADAPLADTTGLPDRASKQRSV